MSSKFPAVKSTDVIKVLRKIGFEFKRQSGSNHAIYFRASDKKRTTVPVHSGKTIKRKTLWSILSDTGLTMEEFKKLRKK